MPSAIVRPAGGGGGGAQSKPRAPRQGTLTVATQGVKWVKHGQDAGALYGIHRVLQATAHPSSPYVAPPWPRRGQCLAGVA